MYVEEDSLEARLLVTGRVQGCFYRSFVQRVARLLGLYGFAKNTDDGHVEVVVEGSREAVEELIMRLYEGPSGSSVDDIEVQWRAVSEQFKRFEIR